MLISYSLEDGAKEQLRHFYLMILLNLDFGELSQKDAYIIFPQMI